MASGAVMRIIEQVSQSRSKDSATSSIGAMRSSLGAAAAVPGSADDVYLYDFNSNHWWYTSTTLFPYLYDFNLPDVAEVWRRGSVIASWLLDLTASALIGDPELAKFGGRVSDSGEGRWTIKAAIDEGVPTPVLTTALYTRFSSRGEADFSNKLLSAMRFEFGGHLEKPAAK